MNLSEHKEVCGVCDLEKPKGIHLYNLFICCECEQKMVHTEPSEEQYKFYLDKLKHINQPKLYS
ncbi:sigma factor G inhibitor Gin [Aquibacillus koreensis]|uniref:Sigma factor G inhibitor Gin n=1 Tax=Aquibacillus koreensis TaxID=279446 RepID=A0A9X3WRJ2_9BACI|nr:sigma factor G inhibitor Gin [Aquibacillus koreensis]MCT2534285.1 sigma factor G inhibitor Gin [Aquibacillus koreensis]MDC3422416.1 sigma factor G inhibitor Gin [Aquibacillus koreensis]